MDYARIPSWIAKQVPKYTPILRNWWAGQSRIAQLGYVSAGTWATLLGASRFLRTATERRGIMDYPPPRDVQQVYGEIRRGRDSQRARGPEGRTTRPAFPPSRLPARSHLPPTGGLVQQIHRDRQGHTMQGGPRSRGHLRKLFNIG